MNRPVRVTSEVVRVRGHFLVKLTDFQWALAKHGIAAGEAFDDDTISLQDIAFFQYTSGSTGNPKGASLPFTC